MVLASLVVAIEAGAQYFIDDFEDGDAMDGMPVTWTASPPFDTGQFEVIDGAYVITPGFVSSEGYYESDAKVANRTFGDVSLRTQIHVLGIGTSYTGFWARYNGDDDSGVWAAVREGGRLLVGAYNETLDLKDSWEASSSISPVVDDLNLQFNLLGNRAELYAWRSGHARPISPQLIVPSLPDYLSAEGSTGVFVANGQHTTQPIPAAFRWFGAIPGIFDADFDFDSDVDGEDLAIWKNGFGAQLGATPADGNTDGDGDVDGQDFLTWQTEFGMSVSSAASLENVAVPEPATVLLLFFAGACSVIFRPRFRA